MKELITKEESNAIKERMIFLIELKDREKFNDYISSGGNPRRYVTYKRKDLFKDLGIMNEYCYASGVLSFSEYPGGKTLTKTPQFTKLWEGLGL